jgi:hypothetical protein
MKLSFFKHLPVLAALGLSSCSSLYIPNVPNTPMLSTKGEFSGGAHVSIGGNLSLNGAYAASNHFGVIGSASLLNNDRRRKDLNQKLVEIGGGYFNTFGPDDNRIIEVYAGFGSGKTDRTYFHYDNDILTSTEHQETTYNKTFFQVNYSSKKANTLKLFGKVFPINYGTAIRISQVEMKTFLINRAAEGR